MEDVASLIFIAGGALTYPLFFHLSLKKSLNLVSREKVANGRILLSLVVLYLETVVLVILSTPLALIPLPYFASILSLSAIVLLASYTLKAMFGLSFRRGILAFALWQVLCLALGGTLMATILAAASETILTFPLITALILLAWWMWSGRQSVVTGEAEMGVADGTHVDFGDTEKKIAALVMVALLFSTLLAPSTIRYVACEPQEVKGEEVEVEGDFSWVNETIRAYIAWVNATLEEENITHIDSTTVAKLAATWLWEFSNGFSEETGEYAVGLVNVPGALTSLHDAERDLAYLSLLSNVTSIQDILKDSQPILQRNPYGSTGDSKGPPSSYARDAALADELADLSKKGFKVSVAEDPDSISKAFDIERYVESVAWSRAAFDLLVSSLPLAGETYRWIESTTGDKRDASYGWLRTFGLTAPLAENAEAFKSGDPGRIGRSVAQTALSYTLLYVMIKAAVDVAKAKGVAAGVAKAAYDYIVPAQGLYGILKSGFSGIKGALSDIGDTDLRAYLEGAWVELKARLTGYEYIPFLSSDDEVFSGVMPNDVLSNVPGIIVVPPEKAFDWSLLKLDVDSSITKKISSDSWVRYFIKAIKEYQKLDQNTGGTEMLALKIKMEKGIAKEGYTDSIGKSYYDLTLVDTGSIIRVYEDNTISVWYNGGFRRLRIEQLEADSVYTGPLETDGGTRPDGRSYSGVDLTTILMRDFLEKIGFYDQFVIGQETNKVFGVKGIVKDNRVGTDGPYVTIEYKTGTGRVREVRISSDGATVNTYLIVGVETGEDGAVNLLYEHEGVHRTPIKLPVTTMSQGELVKANYLTTGFNYNDIVGKIGAVDLLGELDIKCSTDYTDKVAYAAFGANKKAFDAQYGEGKCDAFLKAADIFSESTAKEALGNMGLDIVKAEVERGVRPAGGKDIVITTKDGNTLILDIEYTQDDFPSAKWRMAEKFANNKADLGMIFYKGKYYVYINSATEYEPLANIAKDITRTGSRSIKDFAGIAAIGSLGLLSGYFSDAKGEAVSVTDDAGRWIGEFQDSHLDHTAVFESTVSGSWLTLTSVERSYLQNVRSSGTTVAESAITNCNVSAKLIYDSIVQNTLAVCSYIANSVIDLCRILNSTLVSVVDLVGSHIEDTFASYSANISNCTVVGSNLMSVVNLVNTNITNSYLTLVANVDNTKIDHSDISYSANISRSEITDTKLVGCTVQGSKLTSCTAVDSNFRNVNATNSNLLSTSAELSNLVNVNATNSKLTMANVECSNLNNVELKKAEVIGTDLANRKVVDQTIVYGRVIDSNGNIIDPWRRMGTPNYSGQSASSSTSKTTTDASSGKGGSTVSSATTSSNSGQTKTSSTQATTSQGKTSNSQASTVRQKLGQQGSNAQQASNVQTSNTKTSDNQATANQQIPPMMRQKLGGQVKADTSSSAQTSSNTHTETPQKTTTTTSPQTSTTTSKQTVEKPIMRGVRTWIS